MIAPSRWIAALAATTPSQRFRLAGWTIAVTGLAVAAWIRLTTPETAAAAIPLQRLKAQERQLEMIGGKFAVEAARFSAWFDGLWVGRDLATTLAVITVATTLLCLWLAHIAAREPFDDDPRV